MNKSYLGMISRNAHILATNKSIPLYSMTVIWTVDSWINVTSSSRNRSYHVKHDNVFSNRVPFLARVRKPEDWQTEVSKYEVGRVGKDISTAALQFSKTGHVFVCSEAVEFKLVKLKTKRTVIRLRNVSVLRLDHESYELSSVWSFCKKQDGAL